MTENNLDWKSKFNKELPLLGHRNWVLVVDKAFPMQSSAGMEVLNTEQDLLHVLEFVTARIKTSTHVKPIIYTDEELNYIHDDMKPGADAFRTTLQNMLKNYFTQSLLHESVFTKLDESAKLFKVLVLKTECTIPYSSVFMQLDCAYWNDGKEVALRKSMAMK
jgi:D-ribose pyranose/furanose isomerase RbsD